MLAVPPGTEPPLESLQPPRPSVWTLDDAHKVKSMRIFQNKILRGFLKLSNSSPVPSLYFLFGELPVEGIVHINTLITFHNIWSNPDTTVFKVVKYILTMCKTNSATWSNHLQLICLKYGLPPPLSLLQTRTWPKKSWKCLVKIKIAQWYEQAVLLPMNL